MPAPTPADSLPLPPARRGTRAARSLHDAALVAGFVLALVLPLALALVGPAPETMRFENRRPEPWPVPRDATSWRSFTGAFERALADRIAGRATLVGIHHAGKALLFGVSPVRTVMLGRDGWYYWLGEDGRALDRFHRGTLPVADDDLASLVTELRRRRDHLASRGIGFVVVIAPEKFTVYPEHLPSWVHRAERTPLDRVAEAMRQDGKLRFVDLRQPLREGKSRARLYYRTDSHWNLAGATVAYAEIMRAANAELPPSRRRPPLPAPRPPYDPALDRYAGDLVQMLAISGLVQEEDFVPFGKLLAAAPARCAQRHEGRAVAGDVPREEYRCDDPTRPRLLMLRDSMAIPLIPLIAENFSRSVFVSTQALDLGLVDEVAPDVVVQEFVERALGVPAFFPPSGPR